MNKRIWTIVGVIVVAGIMVGFMMMFRNARQGDSKLQGKSWEWNSMKETLPTSQSIVQNPANYTITFNNDGTMVGQADCNKFSGIYAAADGQAGLQFGSTTMSECGPKSLFGIFLTRLATVDGYILHGNELILTFGNGAGEMLFKTK